MISPTLSPRLPQPAAHVKFQPSLPGFMPKPASVIHHKVLSRFPQRILYREKGEGERYGVSSSRRLLTRGVFHKRFDHIRKFLAAELRLTAPQREVILQLLRLWAYYGRVYPKAGQVAEELRCGKATFWRTVRLLTALGLLNVTNRYLFRPHAQISNEYRLDRLLLAIGQYLREHGGAVLDSHFRRFWDLPGADFWRWVFSGGPVPEASPPAACPQPGGAAG